MGLGLSIVRWIAAFHGGEIRVKSRLGEGTEVRFFDIKCSKKHQTSESFRKFQVSGVFLLVHFRKLINACLQFFIGRNIVAHLSVVEFFVGNHIKVTGSGQTKQDCFFFSGFLTL